MTYRDTIRHYMGWTLTGVDFSLPGNGGPDCVEFIPHKQKIVETVAFSLLALVWLAWSYPRIKLPERLPEPSRIDSTMKRVVLMAMCLIFGIELGFKFASHQFIWILNPCHIISMMQIFLLVAPPSKTTMIVFRLHMHCLSGATIAFIFPVVNTRLLPFETEAYYIQHLMMLVVPYYLMRVGGVYTTEVLSDYTYVFTALGLLFIYHWCFLQWLAVATTVNLNNMLCPAISDPFYGTLYRFFAVIHQTALILIHGKVYTFFAQKLLPKDQLQAKQGKPGASLTDSNGHLKAH